MNKRKLDRIMTEVIEQDMLRSGSDLPDFDTMLRVLEKDAMGTKHPAQTIRRGIASLMAFIAIVLCIVMFYVLSILIDSPITRNNNVPRVTAEPGSTPIPLISMPQLINTEAIAGGYEQSFTNTFDVESYFTLPFAELTLDGYTTHKIIVRDERSISGSTARSVRITYIAPSGAMLMVGSYIPGEEAAQWLEEGLRYIDSNSRLVGNTAILMRDNSFGRLYTLYGMVAYSLEGNFSDKELSQISEKVYFK